MPQYNCYVVRVSVLSQPLRVKDSQKLKFLLLAAIGFPSLNGTYYEQTCSILPVSTRYFHGFGQIFTCCLM